MTTKLSRRNFIKTGVITLLGALGASAMGRMAQNAEAASVPMDHKDDHSASLMQHSDPHEIMPNTVGEVDHNFNGFNPSDVLTDFDYGEVFILENGQTLREYNWVAVNKAIEIAPGIEF